MGYVERLCAAGMRPDDACLVVSDFNRELNFDGLDEYVKQYERLAYVGADERKPAKN